MLKRISIMKDLTNRYPPKEAISKLPDHFFGDSNAIVPLSRDYFQDLINYSGRISIEFGDDAQFKPGYLTIIEGCSETWVRDAEDSIIQCEIVGVYSREGLGISYATIHLLG